MKRLITFLMLLCCCAVVAVAADKKFTLVIDAGHGGKDPGVCTKKSKEKNIALKTALAFGKYVEQNCPDVKVIYTRKTDVFIELHERAGIANRNHADLFISFHVNSVESRRPITGIEVYSQGMRRSDEKLSAAQRENSVIMLEKDYKQKYKGFDPNSPESMILFDLMFDKTMENSVELSRFIQTRLKAIGRPGRVKQDNFAVLRETALAACLVELGYITTPSEEQYMNNDANLDKMAYAVFLAFQDYRKKIGSIAETTQIVPPMQPLASLPTPEPEKEKEIQNNPPVEKENQPQEKPKEEVKQPEPTGDPVEPIFKVQLFVSKQKLKKGDKLLKGVEDFDYYEEGAYMKYTTGASADYNEISRLRRQLADRFPEAFIVAFKNNVRMDVQEAIREFKNKKK